MLLFNIFSHLAKYSYFWLNLQLTFAFAASAKKLGPQKEQFLIDKLRYVIFMSSELNQVKDVSQLITKLIANWVKATKITARGFWPRFELGFRIKSNLLKSVFSLF